MWGLFNRLWMERERVNRCKIKDAFDPRPKLMNRVILAGSVRQHSLALLEEVVLYYGCLDSFRSITQHKLTTGSLGWLNRQHLIKVNCYTQDQLLKMLNQMLSFYYQRYTYFKQTVQSFFSFKVSELFWSKLYQNLRDMSQSVKAHLET